MKKAVALVLTLLLCLTACDRSPSYQDLDGHQIRLSQFHGKWLIINYWASWCKSCYTEIPELNAFYHAHKKEGIGLVGVNYDLASNEELKKLAAKFKIEFPVLTRDPAKQLGIDNVPGLPTTYIVGPDGKISKVLYGPQTQKSLESAMIMKFANKGKFNDKYLQT